MDAARGRLELPPEAARSGEPLWRAVRGLVINLETSRVAERPVA